MTSGDTAAVNETSEDTKWVVYTLAGRDIEFIRPTPEQLMVLKKLVRQLDDPAMTSGRQIITIGKVLDAVSACMVNQDDGDYADSLILDRKIDLADLTPMVVAVLTGGKKPDTAPKTGPARRVRRR